ncbi:pyridoxamine 5'-phosphate oxidase family protein [Photobacterium sp. WH77]|uniref:pyridoxamine 5'-phosphate oxidase family protein n=1 Tax=unclassified Photobacterium TaxID=2628852 RepID=UPI001C46A937|nr:MULTISPECIES: pyridoxamine 5'-phosphate oxidase family protein [unclassified Photobacterium]MBV7262668.1 pyridoxamine 5'-phosphate oxidase family protein [Photobacterium sp. WH24]MCG2837797.1 pyridoxamine 5'-phosphate oxidase family protein [Photobacterium sp. WH77]MCG2845413.1 pyridoxamine 5'-phosphate oxidase family protein [Photobacterium sp. WH80]MDO6582195.1 pyridoxamine 5'-phosphate oxidase family protein [Photobacterium sp. 2_MG-2023]
MQLKEYADRSVLCWLATVGHDSRPNVSPKEIFTLLDETLMLIANIASPGSETNILLNPQVCVSFVDVFEQRGFKVTGSARIVNQEDSRWEGYLSELRKLADEKYPIKNIFEIRIESFSKIVAPGYHLFADTTPESQIENALSTYKVSR